MTKLKKVREKAWHFYSNWRKEKTYCFALNCEVKITLLGWEHIIRGSRRKKRTAPDIARRLKLLPSAKQVIETALRATQNRRGNKIYYTLEDSVVRVVLFEGIKGEKIFYSVMRKKVERNALARMR